MTMYKFVRQSCQIDLRSQNGTKMGTDQFLRLSRSIHPMVVPWAPLPIVLPARPPSSNPEGKNGFEQFITIATNASKKNYGVHHELHSNSPV